MTSKSKHVWELGKANAVFRRLDRMESNGCSVDTKALLYESIVLSTLLYGAETWLSTVANGRRLEAVNHRWMRRILRTHGGSGGSIGGDGGDRPPYGVEIIFFS